jgi:hypothetical protein
METLLITKEKQDKMYAQYRKEEKRKYKPYDKRTKYSHIHPGMFDQIVLPKSKDGELMYIYYNLCDKDEGLERVSYLLSQSKNVNQTFITIGLEPTERYYNLAVKLMRKYKLDESLFLSSK